MLWPGGASESSTSFFSSPFAMNPRGASFEMVDHTHFIWNILATDADVARLQSEAASSAFDREQSERVRRAQIEAETLTQSIAHEKEKLEKESALSRLRLEQELIAEGMRLEAQNRQTEKEIALEAARRKVDLSVHVSETLRGKLDPGPASAVEVSITQSRLPRQFRISGRSPHSRA